MTQFENSGNANIVLRVIEEIHINAAYLSEIDGQTGDGDHGVNMNKGFMLAKTRISESMSFSDALKILGKTLIIDIGGSMGPIYGTMFGEMSRTMNNHHTIDAIIFKEALENAVAGLMDLAGAEVGDKTLIDCIYPATVAFSKAFDQRKSFNDSLSELSIASENGKEDTRNMVAKIGRAARLGERSKGFLDAGATSCNIILQTMVMSIKDILNNEE